MHAVDSIQSRNFSMKMGDPETINLQKRLYSRNVLTKTESNDWLDSTNGVSAKQTPATMFKGITTTCSFIKHGTNIFRRNGFSVH